MTTATRSVAVVATRLPNIDRRALSQAWYSALHLAAAPARAPRIKALPAAIPARPTARALAPRTVPVTGLAPAERGARTGTSGRQCVAPPALTERRGPTTELARRIERALVRHAPHATGPTTLAIKAGEGRVALLVRSDGATTRIVALCAPHLRERVDRALAHARFALAAGGTRIETALS